MPSPDLWPVRTSKEADLPKERPSCFGEERGAVGRGAGGSFRAKSSPGGASERLRDRRWERERQVSAEAWGGGTGGGSRPPAPFLKGRRLQTAPSPNLPAALCRLLQRRRWYLHGNHQDWGGDVFVREGGLFPSPSPSPSPQVWGRDQERASSGAPTCRAFSPSPSSPKGTGSHFCSLLRGRLFHPIRPLPSLKFIHTHTHRQTSGEA